MVSQSDGISCGTACTHTFDQGTVVQLTATQLQGSNSAFASWGGACSGTQPTCSVTLQAAQTVTANWKVPPAGQTPLTQLSLIAGGIGGSGNVDDIGGAARFNYPSGVATDAAGNLYVADSSNHIIRKVMLATGVVSTLAGTAGTSGSADGTGTAARFNSPNGLAGDGAGNLYVADQDNHTIRQVVLATGVVSTLAGTASMTGSADGTGAASRFYYPTGVATDGSGNLYIADQSNHTLRKVVPATGVVSTIAGTAGMTGSSDGTGAAAQFDTPSGVATDGAGNLYVADYNNIIRKVVLATGVVVTIAGTAGTEGNADGTGAAAQFSSPSGLAADGAGNLYVADSGNSTIRKVVLATGVVSTLAGAGANGSVDGTGAAAQFSSPSGVATDGAGNLYVADNRNNTIRKIVLATGVVSTIAGTAGASGSADGTGAAARFSSPTGVAADGAGNLYIADSGNSALRKIGLANGGVTTLVGVAGQIGVKLGSLRARRNNPTAVTVLGSGELIIVDQAENAVLRVH